MKKRTEREDLINKDTTRKKKEKKEKNADDVTCKRKAEGKF